MTRVSTLSAGRGKSRKRARPAPAGTQASPASRQRTLVLLAIVLAAATILVYWPVLSHSFLVLDDSDYVTANPHVHAGLAWTTVRWAFTTTAAANWHPLTWLSHAFDYQLAGLNPLLHHLDSLLLHALNAVLLLLLLWRMTRRIGASLLVAALFALHPLNVESVAWVAERKNVLSMLFFLLALLAYAWYAQRPDWRRYALVAALFAAGLMAKPMVITLPLVLLLLDYWPLGRVAGRSEGPSAAPQFALPRLLLEKLPLLALSAASAVITMIAQSRGTAVRSFVQFPLTMRVENALLAYGLYLWKMIWPQKLALYPHTAIAPPAWQWMLSALVLIAITAAVLRFRSLAYLPVGWFWYLGTLVPVIGLVQVGEASMADRYAYLPLIGIFIIVGFGLSDLCDRYSIAPRWQTVAAVAVLLLLALATRRQIAYWDSDYDLWQHTLAVAENPFAHDALGSALLDPSQTIAGDDGNPETAAERLEQARTHFERALEIRRGLAAQNPTVYQPDIATTLNNLGNLDRVENRPQQALEHYQQALDIHRRLQQQGQEAHPPDMAAVLNNLATLEQGSGQLDEAARNFQQALAIYRQAAQQNPDQYLPKVAETLNSLALVWRQQNQAAEARACYEEALRIRRGLAQQDAAMYEPYLAVSLNDLGILDAAQQRNAEAEQHYNQALKLYRRLAQQDAATYLPYVAATLNNLALLEQGENRVAEARTLFAEDLDLFQQLYQRDPRRYAADVSRVRASLQELDEKGPSQ